ncbi:PREDICTED: uncharacterized protein LOC106111643 [Papilio polytes]|uniref:uncharacterized protein LOC106111643 n=1 Tax=Papilio polytes TaxID=76194 RepID=UPI0006766DD4|nr:PREDICTED: uncharacterized protein LOC106111643 [Papilio polytes]
MDLYFFVLTCLLVLQMSLVSAFLNPANDVRKITRYINKTVRKYKNYYLTAMLLYFVVVIYLGMYTPLMSTIKLIFGGQQDKYEKLIIVSNMEKIYIMGGFSLFLFVVSCGVRSLISYTAKLLESSVYSISKISSLYGPKNKGLALDNVNILPHLLRMTRSTSSIGVNKVLKDQLKAIIKNIEVIKSDSNTESSVYDDHYQTTRA